MRDIATAGVDGHGVGGPEAKTSSTQSRVAASRQDANNGQDGKKR